MHKRTSQFNPNKSSVTNIYKNSYIRSNSNWFETRIKINIVIKNIRSNQNVVVKKRNVKHQTW